MEADQFHCFGGIARAFGIYHAHLLAFSDEINILSSGSPADTAGALKDAGRYYFMTVSAVGAVALIYVATVRHPGVGARVIGTVAIEAPLNVTIAIAVVVIGIV